jgi:hypothetical protein
MDEHPIHIHGHAYRITATDGGKIPKAGQWPETTVLVPVGATRDVEFIADAPGDWALSLPQITSHHEPDGTHDTEYTGRESKGPGRENTRTDSGIHGHGRKGNGRNAVDVAAYVRSAKHPSHEDGPGAFR